MSLFVAVRPDDDAVEDLQHALEPVRRLPDASVLRWQPPGQWHVTLAFLGDDDPSVVDEVAERLTVLSGRPPIPSIRIRGSGCFGRQVLWMGLADDDNLTGLRAIATAIPPLLRGSGADVDRRPWRPHLTIARARHGDARPVADALSAYGGPGWPVDTLLLVRSSGGPHPEHAVVAEVRLEG